MSMREYEVKISEKADAKMDKAYEYIFYKLKNPQAADSVYDDYLSTCESLKNDAGLIQEHPHPVLRALGLRRKNFLSHEYYVLFRIDGDTVEVTNLFHFKENYIAKL